MTVKLSDDEQKRIVWFDRNFEDIRGRFNAACEEAGVKRDDVILLAATKTVPVSVINHAIENGICYIGENRVQEFNSKKDSLCKDVHRHFIGHLQTNKVKDIVGEVEMIESVHSVKLAAEISKISQKLGIVTDILLEVNIGNEESKSGFAPEELEAVLKEIAEMQGVKVKGLMSIPPIYTEKSKTIECFLNLRKLFIDIRDKNMDNVSMVYLSMGMSDDFEDAIKCGANIVRIGTALFGERYYPNKN
jgi:pyridoxal phosphate enzyme (YggS family)